MLLVRRDIPVGALGKEKKRTVWNYGSGLWGDFGYGREMNVESLRSLSQGLRGGPVAR